jgi:predicted O-linked N-acetylglucosamine transferase (SPINDLY family)
MTTPSTRQAADLVVAGNAAERDGRLRDACELYRKAVDADPSHAPAYLNLGAALEASGDIDSAAQAYRRLLRVDAENPYANYNLANTLLARRELESAVQLLRKALRSKEDFPEANVALSNALDDMGRPGEAAERLALALKQRPDYPGAWHNYGVVLRKLERFDEAEDALRRATELDPDYAPSHEALASLLQSEGRIDEALRYYAAARARAPRAFELESPELFTLLFSDAVSDDELLARHCRSGARLENAYASRRRPHPASRDPERRLRVGYVSADFYRHPVALFAIPVLARHDRSKFDIRCYMSGAYRDSVTSELQRLADGWRDTVSMSDAEMADAIRGDEIDVLVDLTGHSGGSRLGVFAQQPAPVQVSWLGYLNTTGLRSIQYRLCDRHTDPEGSERFHVETLVRLPDSQWCYRPFLSVPHTAAPPCASRGFVTFGSFNQPSKLSAATRNLWRELLGALPSARLVIVGIPPGRTSDALLRSLGDDSRITLAPRVPLDQYFPWFNQVDIALDTTPYSGGTTTCDALWMGVPVVTAPGSRPVSRSTSSLLATAGLADWIAVAPEGYVALTLDKARDVAALAELRRTLRARMQASPLMDEARFTKDLENAYRQMWRQYCQGA